MREFFAIVMIVLFIRVLAWGWARNREWMEWRRYLDRD